ncbi:MAG: penicillin-binding protein 1B, partial [Nitrococcus sp.]|nr:penicillin-binding protein 1B [Nitrococcus sp.]
MRRLILLLIMFSIPVGAAYVYWLNLRVVSEFEGKRWAVPARVYARPLELYAGASLSPENFLIELRAADYRESASVEQTGTYKRQGDTFTLHTRTFRFWDGKVPSRILRVRFDNNLVAAVRNVRDGSE